MTPADRLRELIVLDGRPLSEISRSIGWKGSARLSQIVNGDRADPQLSTAAKILAGLGRKLGDLDPSDD